MIKLTSTELSQVISRTKNSINKEIIEIKRDLLLQFKDLLRTHPVFKYYVDIKYCIINYPFTYEDQSILFSAESLGLNLDKDRIISIRSNKSCSNAVLSYNSIRVFSIIPIPELYSKLDDTNKVVNIFEFIKECDLNRVEEFQDNFIDTLNEKERLIGEIKKVSSIEKLEEEDLKNYHPSLKENLELINKIRIDKLSLKERLQDLKDTIKLNV